MKRTKYTARFKFDRVIESIKEGNVASIARSYGFGTNLLSKWRSDFLRQGHVFFETKPNQELVRLKKKVEKLEQIIGKKEIELNLIQNFADFYSSQNGN